MSCERQRTHTSTSRARTHTHAHTHTHTHTHTHRHTHTHVHCPANRTAHRESPFMVTHSSPLKTTMSRTRAHTFQPDDFVRASHHPFLQQTSTFNRVRRCAFHVYVAPTWGLLVGCVLFVVSCATRTVLIECTPQTVHHGAQQSVCWCSQYENVLCFATFGGRVCVCVCVCMCVVFVSVGV